jgi:hypothetical protein
VPIGFEDVAVAMMVADALKYRGSDDSDFSDQVITEPIFGVTHVRLIVVTRV